MMMSNKFYLQVIETFFQLKYPKMKQRKLLLIYIFRRVSLFYFMLTTLSEFVENLLTYFFLISSSFLKILKILTNSSFLRPSLSKYFPFTCFTLSFFFCIFIFIFSDADSHSKFHPIQIFL